MTKPLVNLAENQEQAEALKKMGVKKGSVLGFDQDGSTNYYRIHRVNHRAGQYMAKRTEMYKSDGKGGIERA